MLLCKVASGGNGDTRFTKNKRGNGGEWGAKKKDTEGVGGRGGVVDKEGGGSRLWGAKNKKPRKLRCFFGKKNVRGETKWVKQYGPREKSFGVWFSSDWYRFELSMLRLAKESGSKRVQVAPKNPRTFSNRGGTGQNVDRSGPTGGGGGDQREKQAVWFKNRRNNNKKTDEEKARGPLGGDSQSK